MNEDRINKDFSNMDPQELWDTMNALPDIIEQLIPVEKNSASVCSRRQVETAG